MAHTTIWDEKSQSDIMHPVLPPFVNDESIALSPNSKTVLEKRYLRKGKDGKPIETIAGMFYRIAQAIGNGETGKAKEFYDLISSARFYPNTPTFTGAGTPLGQLAACFVLPVDDEMGRGPDGIFSTLRNAALIQQTGGGVGFSFGRLREKGAFISRSGGKATGPIGFMRVYDGAFGEIAQGGCFVGETLVATAEGAKQIKDVQDGDLLYTWDEKKGFVLKPSSGSWKTKSQTEVWKLTTDKGLVVYATPDHRFLVRPDRAYVEMRDLKVGTPLLPLTRYQKDGEWWVSIHDGNDTRLPEHVWMANQAGIYGEHIHHADGDHSNNVLSNLFGVTAKQHAKLHSDQRVDDGTHPFQSLTDEQKEKSRQGYMAWFRSLTKEEQSQMQSSRAVKMNKKLIEKGEHNFQTSPPMRDPKSKEKAKRSRIATALWKVMGQGLPVSKESWNESKRVLYNTQQYTIDAIEKEFGTFDDALAYCGERNHRVVSVEFSHYDDVYDVEVPGTHNFVVCDQDRRGVVVHNSRRGANMGVLPVNHPDIREFITCKSEEGKISNFNISVNISDAFMKAVENDETYPLIAPSTGEVVGHERAREIFDLIVEYAFKNGEPGVLFMDEANRHNPVPHLGDYEATNPCGEQKLLPYENCCLGSINLIKHVKYVNGVPTINWDLLHQTVNEATHFLDNVISVNTYVPEVPQLREAALRTRRIGLGIMGLADVLIMMGIGYNSQAGRDLGRTIMEFITFRSMSYSVWLATVKGSFPAIEGSVFDKNIFTWNVPLDNYMNSWGCPDMEWSGLASHIQHSGIRNSTNTTIAPTGTIGTVAGTEGYGCEPVFALGYARIFKDGDKDVTLYYASPLLENALDQMAARDVISHERAQRIKDWAGASGSLKDCPDMHGSLSHFVGSGDISPEDHILMQAALQEFSSNSISKTINFPETATKEDVAKAYKLAHRMGCRGLTVYITGSRQDVVLETAASKAKKEQPVAAAPVVGAKRKRPAVLNGKTYHKGTPVGNAYVTINSDETDQPFEVLLTVGKAGSEIAAVSEAIGRLISLVLRMPGNISPLDRLRWIVTEMGGIGGSRPMGFGKNRIMSLPDGVAAAIKEYLGVKPVEEAQAPVKSSGGDICPECGEASFLNTEGCRKCFACGYSEC